MSAISSRREHTPRTPHSLKTPATTPPKHHQYRLKHTPTLTTETHTTNATPHPHPNTTPHRDFSTLHPHIPHDSITRHLFPQTTPHTARSTTHPEQSTAHDPDTRSNAHHPSTCPTHNIHTRRRPRTEGAPCGKSHQRESLRVRTQQTVFGNSSVPNAWVSPRPSPTHSSRCSARPAASSHARTRCRRAIQPWISERREVGLA